MAGTWSPHSLSKKYILHGSSAFEFNNTGVPGHHANMNVLNQPVVQLRRNVLLVVYKYSVGESENSFYMTSLWKKLNYSTARLGINLFCFTETKKSISDYLHIIHNYNKL